MPEGGVGHYVGAGQIARADHAECDAQVAGIVAYHERNGYRRGGAYNEHVCQHGGRWLHYTGPNQATGNTWANLNLHAVCAVIGSDDVPTPALLTAMRAAWDEAGGGGWITPHSYWFQTACCGDPLRAWIAAGAPAPGGPAPGPTHRRHNGMTILWINFNSAVYAYLVAGDLTIIKGFDGPTGAYGFPQSALNFAQATNCGMVQMNGAEWKRLLEKNGLV